ncbi:MAG: cupin domain-containing protein [Deltaproteobacteria bacterium]|nr:cupin domain-containing protein [Deltaproteobacteria bacterium]
MEIKIEHNPGSLVNDLGVTSWPIWTCEASQFPWSYEEKETCYILEGEVIVTHDGGKDVIIKAGDLVIFPKGMSCHWNIVMPIRKHYKFG